MLDMPSGYFRCCNNKSKSQRNTQLATENSMVLYNFPLCTQFLLNFFVSFHFNFANRKKHNPYHIKRYLWLLSGSSYGNKRHTQRPSEECFRPPQGLAGSLKASLRAPKKRLGSLSPPPPTPRIRPKINKAPSNVLKAQPEAQEASKSSFSEL